MGVQSGLEGVDGGSTDHFGWEAVPVIHDACCERESSDPCSRRSLAKLERVTSCWTVRQCEECARIHVNTTMEQLVCENHVPSAPSIVE